jgi:hypothetical protein
MDIEWSARSLGCLDGQVHNLANGDLVLMMRGFGESDGDF